MALILGGDGTITGNPDITLTESVSIAGTITYEDVTNIDSVGVITARSGINVGPTSGIGITLTSGGNITASGNLESSYLKVVASPLQSSGGLVRIDGSADRVIELNYDGSASFASSSFAIESDGDISTNVRCHGHIELDSTGVFTTPKIKLFSNTGAATFAGSLGVSEDITCNQNLLIRGGDSNGVFIRNGADTAWNAQIQGSGLATFKNKLTVQVDSASAVDTVDIYNGTSGGDNRVKIRTFANGGGDPYLFFDGGGNNMVVGLSYAGTTSNELVMGTGNSASDVNGLRINGLGNITIKPSNVASVSGTNSNYLGFRITQTNNQSALLATIKAQGQSAWGGDFVISTKNNNGSPNDAVTERLRLNSGGKLTVPGAYTSTTTGGGALYVEADGDFLRYTSSLKYKTDVETIENTRADAILNCRPVWYRSKCSNDIKTEGAEKSDWGWYGFIAEEVAEIEPRLVNWATKDAVLQEDGTNKSVERDPSDYEAEGVRYENFVPLLVNLVKRQQAAIETLEAKVQALEGS